MPTKLRYSTDKLNRLIISKDGKRYPVEGEFTVEKNILLFKPNPKSPYTKELSLSKRIRFEGKWQLSDNKDLRIILIETYNQVKGDELEIKGRVISAEPDAVVFQMRCIKGLGVEKVSLLRLGGRWQADEFNQLAFFVSRDVTEDILRFCGSWQINKNQEITYTYEKQDLVRKTKTQEEICFKGYWQIDLKNRLVYILDLRNKSFFEFKVQMESPNLIGKTGEIRYRIGIGVRELARERVLLLFGTWKLGRTKSVSFEMDYSENRIRAITFGASVHLNRDNEFVFELKNRDDEGLGFSVMFNKEFFKDNASLFTRFKKLEQDLRIEAGLKVCW